MWKRSFPDASAESPRLVFRFALLSAACLGIAAAAILGFTRSLNIKAAKQNEAREMSFATASVLAATFSSADLTGDAGQARRHTLDRAIARIFSKRDGVVRVSISGANGRVTYSTDHRQIGGAIGSPRYVDEALRIRHNTGDVISVEGSVGAVGVSQHRLKTLDVYAPLFPHDGGDGVVVVSVDYQRVVAAAMAWFYPVAGILEGALLLLYLLLFPLLYRVSRRLREQVERIRFQANHDDLTMLPNRLQFRTAVDEIASKGVSAAVMIVDLDRFKEVNDTLGHHAGDDLLRQLARRLRDEIGEQVVIARLGGDEFGVLARLTRDAEAEELAARINTSLGADIVIRGVPLGLEASIGIAIAPQHGGDVDTLMQHADLAMYDAKRRLASVAVYSSDLDHSQDLQVGLLAELRRALEENELVLHYQPKLDLGTRTIVGAEALVRWQHPTRGLLYPGDFLAYAERTGLNRRLTAYVLDAALADKRSWKTHGINLPITVNVTMFDLLDATFVDDVKARLDAAEVDASELELEITETSIMSDTGRVRESLRRLHDLGVRIGIDDFGSGYSSLTYLMNLDVDTLKIDKSFVIGMSHSAQSAAIVSTIIDLAHVFELSVVAEGVEREDDLRTLTSQGCDIAQGFFISRPLPSTELVVLLQTAPDPAFAAVA